MKSYKGQSKNADYKPANTVQRKSQSTSVVDNRPTTVLQRKLQQVANASPVVMQAKFGKGLPAKLKANIEAMSGYSLADVKVHYNSSKPAEVGALAYAQGNDIFLGPGQEQHLAHEAWHVVQQKQGRVRPTTELNGGVALNDSVSLEREADRMGQTALIHSTTNTTIASPVTTYSVASYRAKSIQRKIGFEFQAYDSVTFKRDDDQKLTLGKCTLGKGTGFEVEPDGGKTDNELEIATLAVDETASGRDELIRQIRDIVAFVKQIDESKYVSETAPDKVNWGDSAEGLKFNINGSVHFHPQASVGVRYGSIAALIKYCTEAQFKNFQNDEEDGEQGNSPQELANTFGWSDQNDQKQFKETWSNGLKEVMEDFEGQSDRLISFAALLYGFGVTGKNLDYMPDRDVDYAKYYMPFMLRSGLVPHWNDLDDKEKELLQTKIQERDFYSLPIFSSSLNDIPGGDNITSANIMASLNNGEDLLIERGAAGYGHGIDGQKITDGIGCSDAEDVRDGAVIELRKLGNNVPADKLETFALAVFDLIRFVNEEENNSRNSHMIQPQKKKKNKAKEGCNCVIV